VAAAATAAAAETEQKNANLFLTLEILLEPEAQKAALASVLKPSSV
jgi:hypothetical protein